MSNNTFFDKTAFAVNMLMIQNDEFRSIIFYEIIKNNQTDNHRVSFAYLIENYEFIAEWFIEYAVDVRILVEKYPLIQISIPANSDQWDGTFVLPVIYYPYNYGEDSGELLSGYNENGEHVEFDKDKLHDGIFAVVCEGTRYIDATEYNTDFDNVARTVNMLLIEDRNFRDIVYSTIKEQFDGDFNVLISQLVVNFPEVESLFDSKELRIREIVEKYPLIQIAIYMNFEKWDTNKPLPTIYLPYDYQENVTPYLYGYDINGNEWAIVEQSEFDFPVAVINENERVKFRRSVNIELLVPKNLVATSTPVGIQLVWQKPVTNNNEHFDGYMIYRKGPNDGNYVRLSSSWGEDNLSFVDKSVLPDQPYSYYVKSFYAEGNIVIDTSNPYAVIHSVHFTVLESNSSNTDEAIAPPLASPQSINVTRGNSHQLLLEWASVSSYASGYEVQRLSYGNNNYADVATTGYNINHYSDNNLATGTLYRYRVRAITSGGGYSPWSSSISTFASDRNTGEPLKLTKFRFKDKAAYKNYENPLTKGSPELELTVVKGDAADANKIHGPVVIHCKGKASKVYDQWYSYDLEFIRFWYPDQDGSIFTYNWVENDNDDNEDKLTITTSYEDKFAPENTLKAGASLEIPIRWGRDELIGLRMVQWWDNKNYMYNINNDFYWYVN